MNEHKPAGDIPKQPIEGRQVFTRRQVYNLFTDIVGGLNVRLKDNLFQGLAILICLLLGAGIGFLAAFDRGFGALLGGSIGLVAGLLGSGLFLMIYRAVKHALGKHD